MNKIGKIRKVSYLLIIRLWGDGMMKKRIFSFLGVFLFIASGVFAGDTLTIQDIVQQGLLKSSAVRSKKAAYEAARAKVIKAWLPEDPMAGIDVEGQREIFKTGSRMNYETMVSQSVPFPTTLFLRGIAASKEADMAYQDFKEEERKVAWGVEQPVYSLFLTKKTIQALEETKTLLEQFSRAVRARYEAGQAGQIDSLKVGIELSQVNVEIFEWKQKEHVANAEVARQLNQPMGMVYEIDEKTTGEKEELSYSDLEKAALDTKPELQMLKAAVEKARTESLLAKTDWLPELTGRVEIRDFTQEGREREVDNFIGFSVPVWSLVKGLGGAWRGADEEVKAAEALVVDMKNEVLLHVHHAFSRVSAARFAIETFEKETLPQARQQVQIALSGYEAGKVDVLMLIDAQRTLKNLQIQYYKALAEYEMGLSDLRLAVGRNLKGAKKGEK